MDTQSDIQAGKAAPLVSLSWAGLTDEEFIERVADQVWRRPNYHGKNDYGRIGVTRGKVRHYLKLLGSHLAKKERQPMEDRVYKRALELLDAYCEEWTAEVIRRIKKSAGYLRKTLRWQHIVVREVAPEGVREHVSKLVLERYPLNMRVDDRAGHRAGK